MLFVRGRNSRKVIFDLSISLGKKRLNYLQESEGKMLERRLEDSVSIQTVSN